MTRTSGLLSCLAALSATLPRVMVPVCGVSKPTTDRSNVLLPHPLRPTIATNSPAEISTSKFSSTVRPAKAMLTFLIATETPRELRCPPAVLSFELQVTGIRDSLSCRLVGRIPAQPVAFQSFREKIREFPQDRIKQNADYHDIGLHELARVHRHVANAGAR